MANRDDVSRELAKCTSCDSIYAARQWPDGEIQLIGSGSCPCGSTEFVIVDDTDSEQAGGSDEPDGKRDPDRDDDPSPGRTTAE
ncbi:uncharacterized protein Nmag_2696 [Natrialba magadii ATCC 43099]|uniref:Uncharacterized protein n=1 Tax=Natrialba magadii (strain ATCC 43099 / DSM 3394 / CCM 3739 / CIP 104546 / IAM 13178 / JCM 8861 / NBRC 102185 / NCIMB 2190 / MS3) TaxID=547559 RepID=D3SZ60_NATMM|nr:uncharacterized protein Nmag_2696 [Natrialba magadii ATCC 43099]